MHIPIRFKDAFRGYLPKPDLIRKVTTPGWRYLPPRADCAAPVDTGNAGTVQREWLDGMYRGKSVAPHPWNERRDEVIERFKDRVVKKSTPYGYTTDLEDWQTTMKESESELDWLKRTQNLELPPEWLTLRVNGERGESLDRIIEMEDDTYSLKDLVPTDGYIEIHDMVYAHELLGGMRRLENFLKATDNLQWHSTRPRKYWAVVNDEGKRGYVPDSRYVTPKEVSEAYQQMKDHLPDVDTIRKQMEYREQQVVTTRDNEGRVIHTMRPGTYSSREDADAEALYIALDSIEASRTDPSEEPDDDDYMAATPCPNEMCGQRTQDCVVCYGTGYIQHELGVSEELHHTPYWHETHARVHLHGKVRKAIERLDADLAALRR